MGRLPSAPRATSKRMEREEGLDRLMSDESRPTEGATPLGLTRRDFIKVVGASTAGAVVFTGCQPQPRELMSQSRVRLAEDILSSFQSFYATTCTQCDAGWGVIVRLL